MASSWMENPTAETPTVPAVSGVRITMPTLCTCNLTRGRWSLVTDLAK